MNPLVLSALFFTLLAVCVIGDEQTEKESRELDIEPPRIQLGSGAKLMGKYTRTRDKRRRVAEFWGVPYSMPPVGQRRFTEAEVYDNWEGELNCTTKPSPCLQFSHFGYDILGSEDCLYLNIFTPKVDPVVSINEADEGVGNELLPVLVFIHGGAFNYLSGAGKTPKYLLDKDVVLVTLNYRLGPLGFFSLGDDSVVGNLGLRDQMTALKWVQLNIKSFGGDPQRVTISGMSAGGASVHYHLLSPLSKGLYQQAISMSGTALDPWAEAEAIKEKSLELADKLGCSLASSEKIVKCLREKSPEQMITLGVKDTKVWLYNPISPWAPSPEPKTASNPFLPDSPINIILDGKANDVPWLVSYANLEGLYPGAEFVFNTTLRDHLDKNWLALLPHVLEYNYTVPLDKQDQISAKIKEHYLKGKLASDPLSIRPLADMLSDRLFLVGISEAALRHAKIYKSPVYVYRFSYSGQDSVSKYVCDCEQSLDGACHGDDIGYVLESPSPKVTSEQDMKISHSMVELFYSFLATGKPVYKEVRVPEVKMFLPTLMYLDIDRLGSPYIVREMDTGNQHFWASLGIKEPTFVTETNHSHLHEL